jgi:hypothetical protein
MRITQQTVQALDQNLLDEKEMEKLCILGLSPRLTA